MGWGDERAQASIHQETKLRGPLEKFYEFKAKNGLFMRCVWGISGIGEAVCQAVSDEKDIRVRSLCVLDVPHSGPPDALLERYGISAKCIVDAVHQFLHPPN